MAAGRLDGYYQMDGPHIWDFAGASLIVEEAGGHVVDPATGGPHVLLGRSVLATSTKALGGELVRLLQSAASSQG